MTTAIRMREPIRRRCTRGRSDSDREREQAPGLNSCERSDDDPASRIPCRAPRRYDEVMDHQQKEPTPSPPWTMTTTTRMTTTTTIAAVQPVFPACGSTSKPSPIHDWSACGRWRSAPSGRCSGQFSRREPVAGASSFFSSCCRNSLELLVRPSPMRIWYSSPLSDEREAICSMKSSAV